MRRNSKRTKTAVSFVIGEEELSADDAFSQEDPAATGAPSGRPASDPGELAAQSADRAGSRRRPSALAPAPIPPEPESNAISNLDEEELTYPVSRDQRGNAFEAGEEAPATLETPRRASEPVAAGRASEVDARTEALAPAERHRDPEERRRRSIAAVAVIGLIAAAAVIATSGGGGSGGTASTERLAESPGKSKPAGGGDQSKPKPKPEPKPKKPTPEPKKPEPEPAPAPAAPATYVPPAAAPAPAPAPAPVAPAPAPGPSSADVAGNEFGP